MRMMIGFARYQARKAGKPPPIFLDAEGQALPSELGGDGRGPEAIGNEASCPDPNHPNIQLAAEHIKAQLRLIDPNHPLLGDRLPPLPAKTA
jgi:hypothetical protein